jgi:hypothetical protein
VLADSESVVGAERLAELDPATGTDSESVVQMREIRQE